MKWFITLCLVAVILTASPIVSAKEKEQNYTVSPSVGTSTGETQPVSIQIVDSITQGQTKSYTSNIGSNVRWLEYYLDWGNSADSLSLTIYTPSGRNLGTFYDSSDGVINGRIHIDVDNYPGYVESGQWKSTVYGVRVTGTRSYTFNIWENY